MANDTLEAIAPFQLQKQKAFLDGSLSTSLRASAIRDPKVLAAIAANQPLPEGDIRLGEFRLQAGTASPLTFKTLSGPLSFRASGGAYSSFSVYSGGAPLLAALKAGPLKGLPPLPLPNGNGRRYALLAFGYDVSASASAAAALGPLTVKTKVSADSDAFFGVVTAFDPGLGARDAIDRATSSFLPPALIREPGQLAPGTWVLTELDASLGVTVGAQMGLDFNWVREAQMEGLSGDIGLRLQTSVSASIGFRASGTWLVVVSRETEAPVLRLQLYRMSERGLNVAFDAGAKFQANLGILPAKADDFIKGILGVHGAQVLQDLKLLEQWTDPKQKLSELLAGEAMDALQGVIGEIAGVPADALVAKADQVRERVVGLLKAWNAIPHRVATQLMALVSEKASLETLRAFLDELAATTDADALRILLGQHLSDAQFFATPIGRWVEAMAGEGALVLLSKPLEDVRSVARATLALLDNGETEAALLRLDAFLTDRVSLDRITELASEADFKKIEPLLKAKLTAFFGQMPKLEEARQSLGLLIRKRQEFYAKAVQAMQRSYSVSISASFSSTTKSTAQIDASFDFAGNPPGLAEAFRDAIRGNLDTLLTTPQAGLSLNLGQLTHGITRKTNVEITLPFASSSFTHLNQSMATLEAKEEDGRVLVYGLESSDSAVSNHRNSTLSLGLHLSVMPGASALHVHERPTMQLNYVLRQYLPRLDRSDAAFQLAPLIATYFPGRVSEADLNSYLEQLNTRTEALIPNTPEYYGDALFSLECRFAAAQAESMGAVWMRLGKKASDEAYQRMSIRVQLALKSMVVASYFQSPERYVDLVPAHVLLAWASIAPANHPKDSLYWDWMSPDERKRRLLESPQTAGKFRELLGAASERLKSHGQFSGTAKFYQSRDAGKILASVDVRDPRLHGLLFAEATTIDGIFNAGKKIAEFGDKAKSSPSKAVKLLAQFGSKLTEVFNQGAASIYLGPMSRALGTALYVEAVRGLSLSAIQFEPSAFARLSIVNPEAAIDSKEFLRSGQVLDAAVILNDQISS